MKTRNLLLTSVLTITVTGLFGAVAATSLLPSTASAGDLMAGHLQHAGNRGPRGGGHWGGGQWGGGHCGAFDERAIRLVNAYVSISLDLNEAQEAALEPVIGVIDSWHDESAALCEQADLADAPAALNELSGLLTRTRTAVDELIPAFDAFYTALTQEQQAQLNSWISQHHRG